MLLAICAAAPQHHGTASAQHHFKEGENDSQ
jgi:hypothetical protein